MYIIIIWVFGGANYIPNVTGWGGFVFDSKTQSCVWNRLASDSYSIYHPVVGILTPCMVTFICYIMVFRHVIKHNSKVFTTSKNSSSLSKNEFKKSVKIAKSLFASFMMFVICWYVFYFIFKNK